MTTDVLLAGIAVVTVVTGCVRWLIQVYYKKAKENEHLRKRLTDQSIETVKTAVKDVKKEINGFEQDVRSLSTEMRENAKKLVDLTHKVSEIATGNSQRLDTVEDRIKWLSRKIEAAHES